MLIDSMLSFNPEFLEQKCIFSEKELVSIDHNANTLKIDRENKKSLFYKFLKYYLFLGKPFLEGYKKLKTILIEILKGQDKEILKDMLDA